MAPATTNSTAFALVDPERTATKMVQLIITVPSWAEIELTQLQTTTGANKSKMMAGVIRARANRAIYDFLSIWTLESRETLNQRCYGMMS